MPPPVSTAWLPERLQSRSPTQSAFAMPPPRRAWLPERGQLLAVSMPAALLTPPPRRAARLLERLQLASCTRATLKPKLEMAPPFWPALLPERLQWVSAAEAVL